MDCIVRGVAKRWTRLSEFHFTGSPVVKNPPSMARGVGLIPGQETKILHATRHSLKKKKKKKHEGILTQAPSGDHPPLKTAPYCFPLPLNSERSSLKRFLTLYPALLLGSHENLDLRIKFFVQPFLRCLFCCSGKTLWVSKFLPVGLSALKTGFVWGDPMRMTWGWTVTQRLWCLGTSVDTYMWESPNTECFPLYTWCSWGPLHASNFLFASNQIQSLG